ncbi:GYD domain-containing protein [Candidatus Neomarinimicrobiota bacterium]
MITYIMFGKYSELALDKISSDRTQAAVSQIHELGGEVKSMYALMGENDLMFITNFPDMAHAMQASVLLSRTLGIHFSSHQAVTVEEFDSLMD